MSLIVPTYVAKNGDGGAAISTAITILQIKAGAAVPLELIKATIFQSGSATSAMVAIEILRKTAAATVTAFTPRKFDPAAPTAAAAGSTSGTGYTGSAEGTDGDILVEETFNVLNGWIWLPTPEERIKVPAGGIIALKFPSAPASHTWRASMYFREYP